MRGLTFRRALILLLAIAILLSTASCAKSKKHHTDSDTKAVKSDSVADTHSESTTVPNDPSFMDFDDLIAQGGAAQESDAAPNETAAQTRPDQTAQSAAQSTSSANAATDAPASSEDPSAGMAVEERNTEAGFGPIL